MMEEQEKQTRETGKCRCSGDLRTFGIALLTSLIVLALYHSGMMLCKMCCKDKMCGLPVSQDYVLVPVSAMPQRAPGMTPGRFGMKHGSQNGMMQHRRQGRPGAPNGQRGRFRRPQGSAPHAAAPAETPAAPAVQETSAETPAEN